MDTISLTRLYQRDLSKLVAEISAYQKEETIWQTTSGINNSAGNLCLHTNGNLNHFIGAILGNTGYIRQRDLEFSQKNIPRRELLEKTEKTRLMISEVFIKLSEEDLTKTYPINVYEGQDMSISNTLIYLASHLSYHLGQINYHRRLLDVL